MTEISKLMNKTNSSYRELGSGDAKNTDLFFDREHREFFGEESTITVRLNKQNITQAFLFIVSMLPKKFDSSSIHEVRHYSDEFVETGLLKIEAVFNGNPDKDFTWSVRKDVIKKNGELDERLYLNDLLSDHEYTDKNGNIVRFKFTIRDYLLGGYSTLHLTKDEGSNLIKLIVKNSGTPIIVDEAPSSQPANYKTGHPIGSQTIYYGCPGSGKSYEVKMIAEGENGEKIIKYSDGTTNVFRTTFHPDYDYATFVGCYKPVKNEENELDYRFVPQVFTNAYIQALRHTDNPIYLIIEEINRGNCAQIFGDLFQLLDRTNGESDYSIIPDSELAKYLKGQGVPHNELCLPNNLHIYATMNTSDQSLFPMDSAFKRRWAMIYKPIDYTHKKASTFTITIGDGAETITYPWTGFLMMVNDKIINATDSEDKQMGEFFIKDSIKEKDFINKVMFYIWNDVCKDLYNPRRVAPQFFMRINKPLENEKDYFTFAELFSHRNKSSRLLKEFINYLEAEFIEHHKELELDPKQPINWETVKEKLNNQ